MSSKHTIYGEGEITESRKRLAGRRSPPCSAARCVFTVMSEATRKTGCPMGQWGELHDVAQIRQKGRGDSPPPNSIGRRPKEQKQRGRALVS